MNVLKIDFFVFLILQNLISTWALWYKPYSDRFLGLCDHVLMQILCFYFVFKNKVPHARSEVGSMWSDFEAFLTTDRKTLAAGSKNGEKNDFSGALFLE